MNAYPRRFPIRMASIIVAIIFANFIALFLGMRRVQPLPESDPLPLASRKPDDIVAGHPASRAEIDEYISRVRDESLDESIRNLDVNEPLLIRVGIYQSDPQVEAAFQRCLADRRLAKIFENLKTGSRADARAVSLSAFSSRWIRFMNDITHCLDQWESAGNVAEPIAMDRNYYSLCATAFLVCAFATQDEILSAIDDWEAFSSEAMTRVRSNPKLEPLTSDMTTFCVPEPLFVMNIYLWLLLDECGHASAEELLSGMSRRPLTTEAIPFTGWDGHTNYYDFTHQRTGVPVDDKRTLRSFTVCRSWLPGAVFSSEEKYVIVNHLRRQIDICFKR